MMLQSYRNTSKSFLRDFVTMTIAIVIFSIKNKTQTAVINILNLHILIMTSETTYYFLSDFSMFVFLNDLKGNKT